MYDYKIIGIKTEEVLGDDMKFHKVYKVFFKYNDITDYVVVDEKDFTAQKVRELIEQKIKTYKELLT